MSASAQEPPENTPLRHNRSVGGGNSYIGVDPRWRSMFRNLLRQGAVAPILSLAAATVFGVVGCTAEELPYRPSDAGADDPDEQDEPGETLDEDEGLVEIAFGLEGDPVPSGTNRHTPGAFSLQIYEIAFSTDPFGCSNPTIVHSDAAPPYTEFALTTDPILSAAPSGEYECVRLTLGAIYQWTPNGYLGLHCVGSHYQGLHVPDGGDRVDIVLTTASPRELDPSLNGAAVYPLTAPYINAGAVTQTQLSVDVTGIVDEVVCRVDGPPGFSFAS